MYACVRGKILLKLILKNWVVKSLCVMNQHVTDSNGGFCQHADEYVCITGKVFGSQLNKGTLFVVDMNQSATANGDKLVQLRYVCQYKFNFFFSFVFFFYTSFLTQYTLFITTITYRELSRVRTELSSSFRRLFLPPSTGIEFPSLRPVTMKT